VAQREALYVHQEEALVAEEEALLAPAEPCVGVAEASAGVAGFSAAYERVDLIPPLRFPGRLLLWAGRARVQSARSKPKQAHTRNSWMISRAVIHSGYFSSGSSQEL
jgi:hypothetical protein